MKTLVSTLLFGCCIFTACAPKYYPPAVPRVDYSTKYADKLEPGSVLEKYGINFTIEKTKDGIYIYKVYRLETRQLTQYISYQTAAMTTPSGQTKEWWDDGTLAFEGQYANGKREGDWKVYEGNTVSIGKYNSGLKEGLWISKDTLGTKHAELNYRNGKLHGLCKKWDYKGELHESSYADGELVSGKYLQEGDGNLYTAVEEKPRFPGCEDLTAEQRFDCSEKKFLQSIYGQVKYPAFARENGIEGSTYTKFVVEKDGRITDIKVIRGFCDQMQAECERVVNAMPNWIPGKQRGVPVRVQFTLPITFKLQ